MATAKKKTDAEPQAAPAPAHDPELMARAEDGGLSRHRVEEGDTPEGHIVLVNPERGPQ